jgi:hypothetical protein
MKKLNKTVTVQLKDSPLVFPVLKVSKRSLGVDKGWKAEQYL